MVKSIAIPIKLETRFGFGVWSYKTIAIILKLGLLRKIRELDFCACLNTSFGVMLINCN